MMFVTTLFDDVRDDWDAKVVTECVDYKKEEEEEEEEKSQFRHNLHIPQQSPRDGMTRREEICSRGGGGPFICTLNRSSSMGTADGTNPAARNCAVLPSLTSIAK
jgi:hypothetical protein